MMDAVRDPLEQVIRPIVEGQIRGFAHEHPAVVNAVDWYKKRTDKVTTFTNSLAKRIVRDLVCSANRRRIEEALFEIWEIEKSGVASSTAPDSNDVGIITDIVVFPDRGMLAAVGRGRVAFDSARPRSSLDLLPQVQWGTS